jgi:CRP-like cAMP-binding protein
VSEITQERTLGPGTVLCEQGRVAQCCYVILDGEAEVEVGGRLVATVGPGQTIGEMGLIDRLPRSASVTALTDMSVLVIEAGPFEVLLDTTPSLARSLLAELSSRIRNLDNERLGIPASRQDG